MGFERQRRQTIVGGESGVAITVTQIGPDHLDTWL